MPFQHGEENEGALAMVTGAQPSAGENAAALAPVESPVPERVAGE